MRVARTTAAGYLLIPEVLELLKTRTSEIKRNEVDAHFRPIIKSSGFEHRESAIDWALNRLQKENFVVNTRRGFWKATPKGMATAKMSISEAKAITDHWSAVERSQRRINASNEDLRGAVERATDALAVEENLTPEESRKRIMALILERPFQGRFRKLLMRTYRSRCAISECDCPEVLQAAHILAVSDGGNDRASNGLLLRADLHRLFDLKKLTIHPKERTVIISPDLKGTMYEQYAAKPLLAPSKASHAPTVDSLKKHFDRFNISL